MPVIFPRTNNPLWPLPADYETLTRDGKRQARVNAVQIGGTPDAEVASWDFLKRNYLWETPKGMFYPHGVVEGAPHAEWVRFMYSNPISALEAPRGAGKSVVQAELNVRNLLRPYYQTIGFYSTQQKVSENFDRIMTQLLHNEKIVNDFGREWGGSLRPQKGESGSWNHHYLKLRNGASLLGIPIKGASLGGRPNEVYFDDVEKTDELIETPSEHIDKYREFVMSVVMPMATSAGMFIRMVNTAYSRRTFSYWVHTTNDPRIQEWGRLKVKAYWTDPSTGERVYLWPEYLTSEFLEKQLQLMGWAKFSANYLNEPVTDADRLLKMHETLNTYSFSNTKDSASLERPFNSQSVVQSEAVIGWDGSKPVTQPVRRLWRDVLDTMRRFIMVDYANTVSSTSDYSVVHVLGLENSSVYPNTLWSLDAWMGRVRLEELTRRIYQMAVRWGVGYVGIERYSLPVQTDYYDRVVSDLPALFGAGQMMPRLLPIKFPPTVKKADKIAALEWRFSQYRIKLPTDREDNPAYRALFYQIDNATDDLSLLPHDDMIDTLAMHLAIGKLGRAPATPSLVKPGVDLIEHLKRGEWTDESGIPVISGLSSADLTPEVISAMYDRAYEEAGIDVEEDQNLFYVS